MLIENIFDEDPEAIASLLGALDHRRAGFCFDTGHFTIFSRVPWVAWLAELGDRIVELHLHDNAGAADSHSPPGTGVFPFDPFFAALWGRVTGPLCMTIEAHSETDLADSIGYLRPRFPGLLDGSDQGSRTDEIAVVPPSPAPASGRRLHLTPPARRPSSTRLGRPGGHARPPLPDADQRGGRPHRRPSSRSRPAPVAGQTYTVRPG